MSSGRTDGCVDPIAGKIDDGVVAERVEQLSLGKELELSEDRKCVVQSQIGGSPGIGAVFAPIAEVIVGGRSDLGKGVVNKKSPGLATGARETTAGKCRLEADSGCDPIGQRRLISVAVVGDAEARIELIVRAQRSAGCSRSALRAFDRSRGKGVELRQTGRGVRRGCTDGGVGAAGGQVDDSVFVEDIDDVGPGVDLELAKERQVVVQGHVRGGRIVGPELSSVTEEVIRRGRQL